MIRTIADGIQVFPLALDGEAFGGTSDEGTSHAILDAYAEAGGMTRLPRPEVLRHRP